jgi:hypothetical protein
MWASKLLLHIRDEQRQRETEHGVPRKGLGRRRSRKRNLEKNY